jgi:hypothetical protein
MTALVLSGLTAFPLKTEVDILISLLRSAGLSPTCGLAIWLQKVHDGLTAEESEYPFLAYGADWLAFAHLAIAVAFIGPWRDPVRDKWVLTFGLIACAGVIPMALIAGTLRGIPFYWRLVDCSFGAGGAVPLGLSRFYAVRLERVFEAQSSRVWHPTIVDG